MSENPIDAAAIAGLLADDDRRRVLAAVELGHRSFDAVASATALTAARVAKAMGRLAEGGLVEQDDDGLRVASDAFRAAAREALARQPSDEHAAAPDEMRKVLSAFVIDGRITSMPAGHGKRLVLLDWLAQDFEPGRRYSEQMVNLIIGRRHADTAAWRRYLVDEGFLARDAGEYWRIGGTTEA